VLAQENAEVSGAWQQSFQERFWHSIAKIVSWRSSAICRREAFPAIQLAAAPMFKMQ
jgi:hypothetical protein